MERPQEPWRKEQLNKTFKQNQSSDKRDNTTQRKGEEFQNGPHSPKGQPEGRLHNIKKKKGNINPREKTKSEAKTNGYKRLKAMRASGYKRRLK
jgi:hypothetical protein